MRKSSKVLAIVFLLVAGGLVFWTTRRDSTEIQAAVEARVEQATADRKREMEEEYAEQKRELEFEYAEQKRALEVEYAGRQQALADTLAAREQAIEQRLAELDEAIAGVEHPVYFRLTADTVAQVLRRMGLTYDCLLYTSDAADE